MRRRSIFEEIEPLTLTAVYDVNSTTSATKICSGTTYFSAMEIDGVVQPSVVQNYTFSTTGEHTVKLTLTKKEPKSLKGGFYNCSRLKRITLPDGLTTIGSLDTLFYFCNLLENLIIPDSVTRINESLLWYCSGITSLNIPKNVNYINFGSSGIVRGCSNLATITVDANNPIYDSRNNCNGIIETATNTLIFGINNTTMPNSVTKLGSYCYLGLSGYSSTFVIPSHITEISTYAFVSAPVPSFTVDANNPVYDSRDNCGAIIETATNTLVKAGTQMTTIPSTVTAIGPYALEANISTLEGPKVSTIPNSITSIGEWAFYYYGAALSPSERDLVIPNSVTTIEHGAFSNSYFKSITLPSNLSIINDSVFYYTQNLETVVLPNTVTEIGQYAFSSAKKLSSIDLSNVITFRRDAFGYCSTLASVNLSSASEIGSYAFRNCSSLATVSIGNNLISVGDNAFNGCTSLPTSNNIRYADTIAAEVIDKTQTSYTLRTDTTHINSSLFQSNTNITTIDIPSSVSYIGYSAFSGCSNLSSVTVRATTPPTIGTYAFPTNTSNLKIYVPSGSVDVYKAASGWSSYASKIYAIP